MNSTLPLPHTKALADALNAGFIRLTPYDAANAIQFRKNVASYIQGAKLEDLAPIAKYTLAYEGIHAIAVGFLFLHGLAPSQREGHRSQALSLMYSFLELDADDRYEIDDANRMRNDKLYKSPAPPVSATVARQLVELAARAEAKAKARLPEWYALA
ncbi:hypothetical protein [Paraburkholderia sp. BCC1886]|uniref:hypothetical protein n=1 Tax=Paraburkholderia sp. BCC1886 TaxID=2562670 RepID=UPI0011844A25|nr:hypothetical protein [Paraburkholderia sp. BCC1886]